MEKKKSVLWVNHFFPYPAKGGLLIRTNGLLNNLSKYHDVTVVCVVQPRLLLPYYSSVEEGLCAGKKWANNNGIKIHYLTLPSENTPSKKYIVALKSIFSSKPYSVNWLLAPEMKKKLSELISQNSYDVIHVDTMGLAENLPFNEISVPIIVNHHNAEHRMMERRARKEDNKLKSLYFKMEAKKIEQYDTEIAKKINRHITCSREDAEEIAKLGDNIEVTVVPNGVNVISNVERAPIGGQFLFVGGLDWYPNADAIIYFLEEITPVLLKKGIKFQLDIIGKNPSQRIIDGASKFEFVTIHGYVDDIDTFYQNAQAFICPLRDGGGTKLKVLDAMMHGLPVIGTDIAFEGIEVVNERTGFVCNSTSDFVQKISDCVNAKPLKIEQVGQAARQLAMQNYCSTKIGESYARYISSV